MVMTYGLQSLAQTRIDSALTGMLMGATPLYTAVFAALLLRRRPGRAQAGGLLLGFAGVALMGAPSALEASASAEGIVMIVASGMGFALATNLIIPLQRKYGVMAVIAWAQLVGLIVTLPWGILDAAGSELHAGAFAALAVMGPFGPAWRWSCSRSWWGASAPRGAA